MYICVYINISASNLPNINHQSQEITIVLIYYCLKSTTTNNIHAHHHQGMARTLAFATTSARLSWHCKPPQLNLSFLPPTFYFFNCNVLIWLSPIFVLCFPLHTWRHIYWRYIRWNHGTCEAALLSRCFWTTWSSSRCFYIIDYNWTHSRRTWTHQETQSLNQRGFSYKEV